VSSRTKGGGRRKGVKWQAGPKAFFMSFDSQRAPFLEIGKKKKKGESSLSTNRGGSVESVNGRKRRGKGSALMARLTFAKGGGRQWVSRGGRRKRGRVNAATQRRDSRVGLYFMGGKEAVVK